MATPVVPAVPVKLFYSYAHTDEPLRDELQQFLVMLRREGTISEWYDRRIGAGMEWAGQIDEHLASAGVILILVSQSFLASNYCYDVELSQALKRHEAGDARVIPVILRPCEWHATPFAKLQALPRDGRPITRWDDRDEAFLDVTREIRKAIEDLRRP